MARRKDFSWFNEMTVPAILEAMRLECDSIPIEFRRSYAKAGLAKLITEAKKPTALRNQKEMREVWKVIQPDLRAYDIIKPFDTPVVKTKIVEFLKGEAK